MLVNNLKSQSQESKLKKKCPVERLLLSQLFLFGGVFFVHLYSFVLYYFVGWPKPHKLSSTALMRFHHGHVGGALVGCDLFAVVATDRTVGVSFFGLLCQPEVEESVNQWWSGPVGFYVCSIRTLLSCDVSFLQPQLND